MTRKLGFPRCEPGLLTRIVVVDWLACTPWTKCEDCSTDALGFLSAFNHSFFLKLKRVSFDLEGFKGGYAALGEQLIKASVAITFTFTAVGRSMVSPVARNDPIVEPRTTPLQRRGHTTTSFRQILWSCTDGLRLRRA